MSKNRFINFRSQNSESEKARGPNPSLLYFNLRLKHTAISAVLYQTLKSVPISGGLHLTSKHMAISGVRYQTLKYVSISGALHLTLKHTAIRGALPNTE
jgi:hypothetical protein